MLNVNEIENCPTFKPHENELNKCREMLTTLSTERGMSNLKEEPDIESLLCYFEKDELYDYLSKMLMCLMCIDVKFNRPSFVKKILKICPEAARRCTTHEKMLSHHLVVIRYYGSAVLPSDQYELLTLLGNVYPSGFSQPNKYGELPLHIICSHPLPCKLSFNYILNMYPYAVKCPTISGKMPLHCIFRSPSADINYNALKDTILQLLNKGASPALVEVEEKVRVLRWNSINNSGNTTTIDETDIRKWSPLTRAIEKDLQWFINFIHYRCFTIHHHDDMTRKLGIIKDIY